MSKLGLYVKQRGKIYGPFDLEQVRNSAIDGKLKPHDLISSSGLDGPWEEYWLFNRQANQNTDFLEVD